MTKRPADSLEPTVSIAQTGSAKPRHTCKTALSEGVVGPPNPATGPARDRKKAEGETHERRTPPVIETQTCHVYRFYGPDDELLYVGLTHRPPTRFSEHKREKEWWVEIVRIELDHCESRQAATQLERELIARHRPPYNIACNPEPTPRRTPKGGEETADTMCCGCCGAPEAFLQFRRSVSEFFYVVECGGQPPSISAEEPDDFRVESDEWDLECWHCGDVSPLKFALFFCTESEALQWLDLHPEAT